MISQILEKNSPFNRAQDVVRKPLIYSAHCGPCWSQGSHSNFAREISRAIFARGERGGGGMSHWVYVTLSCHNWKRNEFRYSGAFFINKFCVSHKCVLVGYSRHKKKTTFIGGMELVSLRCNRDFTSYEYAIATQWYQFHTTDAWWFSLITCQAIISTNADLMTTLFKGSQKQKYNQQKFSFLPLSRISVTSQWVENYRIISNIIRTKFQNLKFFLVSACSCLCAIYWSHVFSAEWRCGWRTADRWCSNYIWVINNLIAY